MSDIGSRLREARTKKGINQGELADLLQCSSKAISRYENNENLDKVYDFIKICKCLDADINYIASGIEHSDGKEINPQEQQVLNAYRVLSDSDKRIVDFILGIGEHDSKSNPIETKSTIVYRFPVYEQQAAAGAGITGRDGKFTMENIFTDDIPQNAIFGVHIKGESMINTDSTLIIEDIPDNSIVLLNPKVSNSDLHKTIVVASINNEVICKYFLIEKDGVHFYSLNRKEHEGDDRFAKSPNDYRIIGQVVKIIKPNEHE